VRLGLAAAPYPADGYSAPYRRAAALGTLAAVMLGAALLYRVTAARFGPRIALLAVGAAVVASPIAYYAFVVPTMAHGPAFAAAAAMLWAWDRAERSPSARTWAALGASVGLVALMRSPAEVTGPINLGNPVEFTMIELARQVLAITGSSSSLVHAELPADDPRQRQPDISRARNLLGWEPQVPLERGLLQTVAYFRDIVEAATPA